jgi:hypothetical protein
MSKNSFKKQIQSRYQGRGNTWVKVLKNTKAYDLLQEKLNNINDAKDYIVHIEREGFGWLRFSKVEGTESSPIEVFELRYRSSKEDHPDCLIFMSHNDALEMPLLGNTPVKLQLEIDPNNRKNKTKKIETFKTIIPKSQTKAEENISEDHVKQKIEIIKEAILKKPSDRELENWYEFLKLNDLYEENV